RLAKALATDQTCTVSYGHSIATALGMIATLRRGPEMDGRPTEELVLKTSFAGKLKPLSDEGAFFVTGMSGGVPTRVPIRHVAEENGATVLRYEPRELRNGTPFAAGGAIVAQRPFSYGNLRDSDPEPSTHIFADAAYGTRAGKPYPLWNWCVLFTQFRVDGPQ
ncbi:MAG: phosphate ABC transporter substrate-binding protein, partial [Verrucomicrobiota bacterium]